MSFFVALVTMNVFMNEWRNGVKCLRYKMNSKTLPVSHTILDILLSLSLLFLFDFETYYETPLEKNLEKRKTQIFQLERKSYTLPTTFTET